MTSMNHLDEHSADWPPRRVKNYGPLAVGQTVSYSREGCYYRPDVEGEFEIFSLGKCESGVIVDMTNGRDRIRTHVWVNHVGHYWVDRWVEDFSILKQAPSQAEMRI